MRIEHIAMYVNDLEAVKNFFITYFNAHPNNLYYNPNTGFCSYFLTFDDGARLEIMNKPDIDDSRDRSRCFGFAHIAFCVGSAENVNALTERFRADGYTIMSEPRTTGDGYYESCILDLEGNQIEITV